MATNYTLSPSPWLQFFNNGVPVAGGQLYTYAAGLVNPAATYSTSSGTPNPNPIILDANGSAVVFLAPGSYSYALYDSVANGSPLIRTQDNITAVSSSTQAVIPGIAGTTLLDGQCCYLSDGSGSLVAGRWYPAQANNAYSSTTPFVAFVIGNTPTGTVGVFLPEGQVTSGVVVTAGDDYYVDSVTAGNIVSTAPTLSRYVGRADSGTSLDVAANPAPPTPVPDNTICDGRLTLTSVTPVTVADVTAATTLYFTPYKGNRLALYSGTVWQQIVFTETSIAMPATTSQMYDLFGYNNAGALGLELLAWTNDTTRATALVLQDGVLCKTGVLTRRYLGSVRTTGSSGQTEDSLVKRYVWNYYNRVPRLLRRIETTASWSYTTATIRQANGSATNQVEVVVGYAEVPVNLALMIAGTTTASSLTFGVGEDSVTVFSTNQIGGWLGNSSSGAVYSAPATLNVFPAVGRHYYAWLERGNGTDGTWYGNTDGLYGLSGAIDG